jgi:hypothetical protein
MVNHEEYMRKIEKQMWGMMTEHDRLKEIRRIVSDYRIEIEEETGRPFNQE